MVRFGSRAIHRCRKPAQPARSRAPSPPESRRAFRRRNATESTRLRLLGTRFVAQLRNAVSIIEALGQLGNLAFVLGNLLRAPQIDPALAPKGVGSAHPEGVEVDLGQLGIDPKK